MSLKLAAFSSATSLPFYKLAAYDSKHYIVPFKDTSSLPNSISNRQD